MRGGFFIWSFRILIYCAGVFVSFKWIVPTFGIYAASPLAAAAIAAELTMSARMKGTSVNSEAIKRVAFADRVLSNRKQLESGQGTERLDYGEPKQVQAGEDSGLTNTKKSIS